MKRITFPQRIIISFIVVMLFLVNSSNVFAQGPNAPEAASFEPVDATDMVNLSTGDLTYVLPLLNIPSPEGGYPLALAYHAGIAMDQDASWTGLGWNLNAGAINRSINGYPDDYNTSLLTEYFYDEGDKIDAYSLTFGYSAVGTGPSVGLGFSWGSHKGLGGFVSIGYGFEDAGGGSIRFGTDGVGIQGGIQTGGGMTLGANLNSNGGFGGSVGFNNNGEGFSLGLSSDGSVNVSVSQKNGDNRTSVGINISSSGVGLSVGSTKYSGNNDVAGGLGVGLQIQFENTVQMGDYTTRTSGWLIPLTVPTPVGTFSLSFGKQSFRYYLGKKEFNYVNGPIYFSEGTLNGGKWRVYCETEDYYNNFVSCGYTTFNSETEAQNYVSNNWDPDITYTITQVDIHDAFMDAYEVALVNIDEDFSNSSVVDANNATFPSYDKYNIQAQGISGNMSSRLFENGSLFGLAGKENNKGFRLQYAIDGSTTTIPDHARFNGKPYFYFENEISSYVNVREADFNYNTNNPTILDYFTLPSNFDLNPKPRRENSTYIEYFTNKEIVDSYSTAKSQGYLNPNGVGFDRTTRPEDGIGSFKITAIDGKTYHYSLPVYNHEIITRTLGIIKDRPNEDQAYFEKRQLEPFATHWLLTAVTGSDYFDTNDNGIADKGDYGYWVDFEYGKWSDGFVWKNPFGKPYIIDDQDEDIKTWVRGRKEIYYLDRVKTRTHTAILIKSEREDAKSVHWEYESVAHVDGADQNHNAYQSRFTIPSQKQLRLDKIILIKEENDNVSRTFGTDNSSSETIHYNNSSKPSELAEFNLKDNVIDINDNWSQLLTNALKVIDFNYDYSLVNNNPNSTIGYGRLTLNSVDFKGTQGIQLIPSYDFSYIDNAAYSFDIEDKDGFGYLQNDNSAWSLNQITTPQGGKINIEYEDHSFNSAVKSTIYFTKDDDNNSIIADSNYLTYTITSENNFGVQIGDTLELSYAYSCTDVDQGNCGGPCGEDEYGCENALTATVIQDLGNNSFKIQVNNNPCYLERLNYPCNANENEVYSATYKANNTIYDFGGIRVASITTTDDLNSYVTNYNYGINEDGVGYISYLPFAPEIQKELPYSAELPSPKVMYEYVSMESLGSDLSSLGKIQYKFNVLKEKTVNEIKFGNLYEIDVTTNSHTNNNANKDVVVKEFTIKDNLASLGQLLEVSTFNNENQLLSKIENTYYNPEETPGLVGVTKESYQSYKIVDHKTNTQSQKDKWLVNSSTRIKYPNLLKKSTEYKSGYEYSSQFGDLDPITGQVNEILSISSDGTEIMSKSIPAYHKYAGMGSMVDDVNNSNMLSQNTLSATYIKNSGNWEEINVDITTWNNDWYYPTKVGNTEEHPTNIKEKVWRNHKSFVWDGEINNDGTYQSFVGEDDNFNWGINATQSNAKWKNISTTTKYDHYSMSLEVKDINDNYATTKMCDDDTKVLFTTNSKHGESFYSGAEYDAGGNYLDQGVKGWQYHTPMYAHTGESSLEITNSSQKGFETTLWSGKHDAGKYKISVWVKKTNSSNVEVHNNAKIHINGSAKPFNGEEIFAGDWVQKNHYETLSASNETLSIRSASGTIYIDDYRITPLESSMVSYVYNDLDQLSYTIGSNNLAVHYLYDEAGRLKETYTEVVDAAGLVGGFKKVSENEYHYKNQ